MVSKIFCRKFWCRKFSITDCRTFSIADESISRKFSVEKCMFSQRDQAGDVEILLLKRGSYSHKAFELTLILVWPHFHSEIHIAGTGLNRCISAFGAIINCASLIFTTCRDATYGWKDFRTAAKGSIAFPPLLNR